MAKKTATSKLFVLGVVLAVIFGIVSYWFEVNVQVNPWHGWILVIIGLIVGFMNITEKEASSFLMAGTVLILVSFLSAGVFADMLFLPHVLESLLLFFTPAVIVVAIKEVWRLAESK